MIEIDQKKLCEFCKSNNYKAPFCTPELDICKGIEKLYLESVGITETPEPQEAKTFRNLSTNDKIYVITENYMIPEIKESNIGFIRKHENSGLCIESDGERFIISPANMDKSKTLISFLLKSDCKKRLDDICTARIATLQKVIDTK